MKYVYLNTLGCQMNVYDSEKILTCLKPIGYEKTDRLDQADMILLNTCSIREKAVQKAFSFIGRLAQLKLKKQNLIIGVGGCVAQQEGNAIIERMPFVDIVFGTHAIPRLPQMVRQVETRRRHRVDIELGVQICEYEPEADGVTKDQPLNISRPITAFVTIMQGCDNFCAYCVVPYVRGREMSRKPEYILREIEQLIASGVREVTLLGQNVNSYGLKEGLCSFAGLLEKVNTIEGLKRIRFTTSHPKDLSEELMDAFGNLDKLCKHIHLPVQSGSNRILERMNRKYTREHYIEKVRQLRHRCPSIAMTSDVIVGFPGETDSDFQQTLDLIRQIEFDSLFAFQYSDRPNAPASKFSDKVPETIKKERLQSVLNLQETVTQRIHQSFVGNSEWVLVEGFSKKNEDFQNNDFTEVQFTGRTTTNKIVNFNSDEKCDIIGKTVRIHIEKSLAHSLWGTMEHEPNEHLCNDKREGTHAA